MLVDVCATIAVFSTESVDFLVCNSGSIEITAPFEFSSASPLSGAERSFPARIALCGFLKFS